MASLAFQLAGMGAGLVGNIMAGQRQRRAIDRATNAQIGATDDAMNDWRYGLERGNRFISDAAQNATTWGRDAADWAGQHYTDAAAAAAGDVRDTAGRAAAGVNTAVGGANAYLDPYTQMGAGATAKLSDLANAGPFTFNEDDPSYRWRLDQGTKALMNTQAGRSLGGAAAKAMQRYAQGAASTEYQAAFDRWAKGRGQQYEILSGMADIGGRAAGQAGQNLIGGARYGGDITTDAARWGGNLTAGAARYAGDVGIDAAQFGGRAGMWGAGLMNQNQMNTAENIAGLNLRKGDIRASGFLGQGAIQAGMWKNLGQFGMDASSALGDYYKGRGRSIGGNPGSTPNPWSNPWGNAPIPGVDDWSYRGYGTPGYGQD